ncbi:hypothetical protein TBLA_0C01820 [Henningerozyma blattae CBS 6284]|uniref:RRM domain-containing protein n=1 Tax=Henningerozyma blattae (strain ATCC 34711 / CBS 6284 / DSM 70876 / NBRC 10599 / NRRL Y-10934 / UCD 77-7) TaxID=1071380 RepID=I2H0U3_HENB6|nr:hypothetical protein TBLA_0C01820 [Tetrapisispora blattae CBS 6284]CCH59995.1 hypothetical protein TBLA_0C01820 [Tetrapisispora blattae CBS 6284]
MTKDDRTKKAEPASRIISFSNLIYGPPNNHVTGTRYEEGNGNGTKGPLGNGYELFGFRRFAKNYLLCKKPSSINEEKMSVNNAEANLITVRGEISDCFKLYEQERERESQSDLEGVPELLHYSVPMGQITASEYEPMTEESLNDVDTHDNSFKSKDGTTGGESREMVVVSITGIPPGTGLGSVLSQMSGGPLRRITLHTQYSYILGQERISGIDLKYFKEKDARGFMRLGSSNLFRVNGLHLRPELHGDSDVEADVDIDKCSIAQKNKNEVTEPEVSRCLLFKRFGINECLPCGEDKLMHSTHSNRSGSTEGHNNCCESVCGLKNDFKKYGTILDVTPIVSRKLCFAVHFANVASAIRAMQAFELKGTELNKKYYKRWAMWYGKDLTDKPSIEL